MSNNQTDTGTQVHEELAAFLAAEAPSAKHDKIGFNAANFEKSIIMDTDDYFKIVTSDGVFPCSAEEA